MTNKREFEPGSYKTTPLDGEEAASHRAMFVAVAAAWSSIEDLVKVLDVLKMLPKVVIVLGAVFTIAAVLAAGVNLYGVGQ